VYILGWHGGSQGCESEDSLFGHGMHDSAAVLLRNGKIVAAIEEERLNRVKHSNFFPLRAIRFCLDEAGIGIGDTTAIVTDNAQESIDQWLIETALSNPRAPAIGARQWIAALFRREFGADVSDKIRFCRHHDAHLCSAWYPSGFPNALVVCLDGDGDGLSGLIAHCDADRMQVLRHLSMQESLGNFYQSMMALIGYERFEEYKVMGLASYGDPGVYSQMFQRMYRLLPDGHFSIVPFRERLAIVKEANLNQTLRRKGEPVTQDHQDFAASLQATLERLAEHVIFHFQAVTGSLRLCLSGGVAHNCTMNGKLLRSGRFAEMYVQPVAHDAGNALGAALSILRESGEPVPRKLMPHLYWGTDVGTDEAIGQRLKLWAPLVAARQVADAPAVAADLIAKQEVVGWVQGRSEFGPRALGNRSILADPRPATNKDRINAMVKRREGYRPFAPAVLEERLQDFFEIPLGTTTVPFMVMALPVRAEMRSVLGAVTHVDGSARVQSVSRDDNPRFHALLEAFGRLTDVPVVLNTSFNNNAEPIVDSIDDAVACFLTTDIDHLVVGDWLVEKQRPCTVGLELLNMAATLPSSRKLVRRVPLRSAPCYSIESTANYLFAGTDARISEALFGILLRDGQGKSIGTLCEESAIASVGALEALRAEVFSLWQQRLLQLRPVATHYGAHRAM